MVRATIVPVLEEIKDIMVGKVESASIFHRLDRRRHAGQARPLGGLRALAPLLRRPRPRIVKVTHEGIGFSLLARQVDSQQVTPRLVEEEAMKFLKRLFGQEQLRRPLLAGGYRSRPAGSAMPLVTV